MSRVVLVNGLSTVSAAPSPELVNPAGIAVRAVVLFEPLSAGLRGLVA
jgi:hypothetical protein